MKITVILEREGEVFRRSIKLPDNHKLKDFPSLAAKELYNLCQEDWILWKLERKE